ncbi:hypothetical protein WJX72_008007 [[Myrmecia] bisecta]|uniref:Lipid II flippase MurJ n=1 Tax=[Myrmecia] bisecta TaxID=41462 RepID=A0AAW1PD74_9CHLO
MHCFTLYALSSPAGSAVDEQPTPQTAGGGGAGPPPALLRVVGTVGAATALCKALGLVREMVIAARFGVGPIVDAYNYASIVPGFFYVLLGGINGPFHTAIAASACRRSKEDAAALVEAMSTLSGLLLAAVTVALAVWPGPIIDVVAPGLQSAGATGSLTRSLAALQLRLMAPAAMLAGFMGIQFGASVVAGSYVLPALSPALSSLTIIAVVWSYPLLCGLLGRSGLAGTATAGAVAIGAASTMGMLLAWVAQVVSQVRGGIGRPLALRWPDDHSMEGVREVVAVLVPAIASSGMLQIAVLTDLYFASFIPGAAAGLGYANMLAMAPIGIISSAVLVPIVPMFAALQSPQELAQLVHRALVSVAAATLLLIALVVPIAQPLVRLAFQREAFDAAATASVATPLVLYISGATAYLMRDVLVRVFQARGNGTPPFIVSTAAIVCNAGLDWYFALHLGMGAPGLVLGTLCVHIVSAVALLLLLKRETGPQYSGLRVMAPVYMRASPYLITAILDSGLWVWVSVLARALAELLEAFESEDRSTGG